MTCAPSHDSNQPGLRPVWAESSLSAWRNLGSLATHWAHSERLWSDWADAHADLSLRWAHRSFCWFCQTAAQINYTSVHELTERKGIRKEINIDNCQENTFTDLTGINHQVAQVVEESLEVHHRDLGWASIINLEYWWKSNSLTLVFKQINWTSMPWSILSSV